MYLLQLLLPLNNPGGAQFPINYFTVIRKELTDKYGGITTYSRSPAVGLWKESEDKTVADDIVIFELMLESIDRPWWTAYKDELEKMFEQDEIVIRYWEINRI
jgi:hypothetical protein